MPLLLKLDLCYSVGLFSICYNHVFCELNDEIYWCFFIIYEAVSLTLNKIKNEKCLNICVHSQG